VTPDVCGITENNHRRTEHYEPAEPGAIQQCERDKHACPAQMSPKRSINSRGIMRVITLIALVRCYCFSDDFFSEKRREVGGRCSGDKRKGS
jgi:hypothetical protein